MKLALTLATSTMTIFAMWLVGKKRAVGWIVGLANQVLWITFAIVYAAWGLLPLTAFLIVVYSRNLWLWSRETASAPGCSYCAMSYDPCPIHGPPT